MKHDFIRRVKIMKKMMMMKKTKKQKKKKWTKLKKCLIPRQHAQQKQSSGS